MDDTERILTALRAAMDMAVTARVAFPEADPACPAALLLPARQKAVCGADGAALLTELTQTLRLTARSVRMLTGMARQAEDAMHSLGYRLEETQATEGLPRSLTLRFSAVTDGNYLYERGIK